MKKSRDILMERDASGWMAKVRGRSERGRGHSIMAAIADLTEQIARTDAPEGPR